MADIEGDNFGEDNVGHLRNILSKYHYNRPDKNKSILMIIIIIKYNC